MTLKELFEAEEEARLNPDSKQAYAFLELADLLAGEFVAIVKAVVRSSGRPGYLDKSLNDLIDRLEGLE